MTEVKFFCSKGEFVYIEEAAQDLSSTSVVDKHSVAQLLTGTPGDLWITYARVSMM